MTGFYYLSCVVFILLTVSAITDTGNYKKSGPRGLYFLFLILWALGYITGRYGGI